MSLSFSSLNDAAQSFRRADCLRPGTTKVWYLTSRAVSGRDERRTNIAFGQFEDINLADLSETHNLMGSISGGESLDEVFLALQGEPWSHDERLRLLLNDLGADHSSMSVGDIIEREDGIWVVAAFGFEHMDHLAANLGAEVALANLG